MAKVRKKQASFYLVYDIFDQYGHAHEKWERCESEEEARKQAEWMNGQKPLRERERKYPDGTYRIRRKDTVTYQKHLEDFVELYGKDNWSVCVFSIKRKIIEDYINPILGDMKVKDISTKILDMYYQELQDQNTVRAMKYPSKHGEKISPRMIREIHKIISKSFELAVR